MRPASDTAPGRQRGWNLLEKLGEGDAGEVYRVEALIDRRPAILKRPRRNVFPSDLIRQAAQIEKEAAILSILSRFDSPARLMRAPALVDQSQPGTEFTERFFIVITPAAGFSLGQLARYVSHSDGPPDLLTGPEFAGISPQERHFISEIARLDGVPELILLRAISGLIEYLEMIHTVKVDLPGQAVHGILWNDVKPDHIYWDAEHLQFTLIDWGNSQYLGEDGISPDRQNSRSDDFSQLIQEFDQLLDRAAPGLKTRLDWPTDANPLNVYSEAILPVKDRTARLLSQMMTERNRVRRLEADLTARSEPARSDFSKLVDVHRKIIALGEIPEYAQAEQLFRKIALHLVHERRLDRLADFFERAADLSFLANEKMDILSRLVALAASKDLPPVALEYGLDEDWAAAFWELRIATLVDPPPSWWEELSAQIRQAETGARNIRPFTAAHRLAHSLLEQKIKAVDPAAIESLVEQINSTVIDRWKALEPDPPDAGIEYNDVRRVLATAPPEVAELLQPLYLAIDQPEAQVRIALDAWERQDFDAARKALRRVLLWDPDRLRLLQADRLLQRIPDWIEEIQAGLTHDEPLVDFVTRLELRGRELRNQIAPAGWLDDLLEAFKLLRKGVDPTDVLVEHAQSRSFLDWLITLEPRRPFLASPGKAIQIERKDAPQEIRPAVFGKKDARLGGKLGLHLLDPLDVWVPEARGSSARIFRGTLPGQDGVRRSAAFKLMRPDRFEYALPLFREEAQILSLLQNIPGVVPFLECGFIDLDPDASLPPEEHHVSAENLRGEVLRYGLDSVHNFLADLEPMTQANRIPYLVLEEYPRKDNLLLHCDTGYTNGHFLPTMEGLVMAIQICDLLHSAHSRNIIYRDHKILHYYWRDEFNGVFMIDWNVARRFPGGLSTEEIQFDIVQFGARALHYILTGRPAPGALPLGPNKPEEIEAASRTYEVSWTYDDQRLPKDIKDVLAATLTGAYHDARDLKRDLEAIYQKLSSLVQVDGG